MSSALPPCDEDEISLTRISVVILQNEELVHSVLLQLRDLDDRADRPYQAAIEDNILLAANLLTRATR